MPRRNSSGRDLDRRRGRISTSSLRNGLAKLLRQARRRQGLSLRKACLAAPVTISPSTLLSYEKNGPPPECSKVLILLWYYGISIPNCGSRRHNATVTASMMRAAGEAGFQRLCGELAVLTPRVRSKVLRALVDFMKTMKLHETRG